MYVEKKPIFFHEIKDVEKKVNFFPRSFLFWEFWLVSITKALELLEVRTPIFINFYIEF